MDYYEHELFKPGKVLRLREKPENDGVSPMFPSVGVLNSPGTLENVGHRVLTHVEGQNVTVIAAMHPEVGKGAWAYVMVGHVLGYVRFWYWGKRFDEVC